MLGEVKKRERDREYVREGARERESMNGWLLLYVKYLGIKPVNGKDWYEICYFPILLKLKRFQ